MKGKRWRSSVRDRRISLESSVNAAIAVRAASRRQETLSGSSSSHGSDVPEGGEGSGVIDLTRSSSFARDPRSNAL